MGALADPERALTIAQGLLRLDNGNTRSHLGAVIMAGAAEVPVVEPPVEEPAATRLRLSAPAGPAHDPVGLGLAPETDPGSPAPGARHLVVERRRDGVWGPAGEVVTDELGRATTQPVRVRVARDNVFRARWAADASYVASESSEVISTRAPSVGADGARPEPGACAAARRPACRLADGVRHGGRGLPAPAALGRRPYLAGVPH